MIEKLSKHFNTNTTFVPSYNYSSNAFTLIYEDGILVNI